MSSLPGVPASVASSSPELATLMACLGENGGDLDRCKTPLEALAPATAPEAKGLVGQASDFASGAGLKLLALPVAFVGLKFLKIK